MKKSKYVWGDDQEWTIASSDESQDSEYDSEREDEIGE